MNHLLRSKTEDLKSPLAEGEYEVFLSFRGPDIRTNFADYLYSSLVRSRIRTFRDEEELRKGEMIAPSLVQAIAESKIYIPIFTQGYAASKWCLMELAKMVEIWRQEKTHIVLPIFYFVDPRAVRHQDGPYKDSFEQHDRNHEPQVVKEWREALQEVGKLKGWHVTESKGQGSIIDEILSKVELYLRSNYTLVTEDLVGIESHIQEVMKLLNLDSTDGRIVGIHGISGIGKTTIAKAVYDTVCTRFDKCCFIENVRDVLLKDDGVTSLQNRVIYDILRHDSRVNKASEGISIIRDRVSKFKVLIVLDDLGNKFEFAQVLGRLSSFSPESRFIITTIDKRVLEFFQDYKLYEVGEMSYSHSLQLFSRHAFRMDHPPLRDATLSQEFVNVAAGFPLALKVIGSLLFGRDRKFWEEKLIELKQIPCTSEKVQEKLKISYNELSRSEKQIFLDIACFFVGEDKDWPFYMWSDCDFYPESGMMTLILRSLVKIDDENKFWMHDHIRDLGRAIVRDEDVEHPYNRSRIWSWADAKIMLKNDMGTDKVKMMSAVLMDDEYDLKNEVFKNLSRLRYLDVKRGRLIGDFSEVLPDLRWLRLPSHGRLPINLNMKKCVIFSLLGYHVKDDWKGWNEIKVAGKLKVVQIEYCYYLEKAPDLSTCGGVEVFKLKCCENMKGDVDIGNLKKLKTLVLDMTGVTVLKGDIGLLQNLQQVVLRDSGFRQVPAGIGKLPCLEILDVTSDEKVGITEDVPTSLKHLSISCPTVPNLLELQQLEELHFRNCDEPKISGDLWKLSKLKTLTLSEASSLEFTTLLQAQPGLAPPHTPPALPASLHRLNVRFSKHLKTLPDLANLSNLTELLLKDVSVRELPGLGELRMLTTLTLQGVPHLENVDGLQNLTMLRELNVVNCALLKKVPDLSNVTRLHTLDIRHCELLDEMQGLGQLGECLTSLVIYQCPCLANVEGIESLESLQVLELDNCGSSAGLLPSSLSKLRKLQQLRFEEEWSVPHDMSLKEFPDFPSPPVQLKVLEIWCEQLEVVSGLDRLESLETLQLRSCESICELPDLSRLKSLKKLDVEGCIRLREVRGLGGLESLRELLMYNCSSIKELNLYGLKNLHTLAATGCTQLKKVYGLEELELLEVLQIDKKLKYKLLLKSAASRYGKRLTRLLGL